MPDTSNSAYATTSRQRGRYMMEESNETKDNIIAEMKRRKEMLDDAVFAAPQCYSTETMQAQSEILDEFIERFEAAHKREKATAEKSSAVGDCAKLRDALTKVKEWMERRIITCGYEFSATLPTMLEDVVLPALAAPPVGYSAVVKGTGARMDWFIAPATEKEGGAR